MITKKSTLFCYALILLLSSFSILRRNQAPPKITNNTINKINGVFNLNHIIYSSGSNSFQSSFYVCAYFPIDTFFVENINLKIDSLGIDTSFMDTLRFDPILFRNYAGTITLNGNNLTYLNNSTIYVDTLLSLNVSSSFNWNVGGYSGINGFTFNNVNPMPSFNYYTTNFPLSLDSGLDFQINLNGITNTDSVCISFCRTDSVTKGPYVIKKFSAINDSVFYIPNTYFFNYDPNESVYLSISLSNYNVKSNSNQNYLFINSFEYKTKLIINHASQ